MQHYSQQYSEDTLRRAADRGRVSMGWLDSRHSFSFGHYFDPQHMGLSALRVINDDRVKGGAGFSPHSHQNMEIISYVLEGAIEHQDSLGNQFVVPAGDVQRMSAGSGITHSEYNHSADEELRFLQIWIIPNKLGGEPSYEQKTINQTEAFTPLVTSDGRDGSLSMQQDANLYRLIMQQGDNEQINLSQRKGYLHVIKGELEVLGKQLKVGDAFAFVSPQNIEINASQNSEELWFDLPS
ncbi:MAG: pirin family protein [Gammaproteobacteria bacterium]|nr:pirin family protein [Gammaproteobacteria bacterium]